jgi:hypothetical protein
MMLHEEKPLEVISRLSLYERKGSSLELGKQSLRANPCHLKTSGVQLLVASKRVAARVVCRHDVSQRRGKEPILPTALAAKPRGRVR